MGEQRIGALILAAGLSSRMRESKPLLEIRGKRLVDHAIGLFRSAGIENIVTVAGHRAKELISVVESASSRVVVNGNYEDGMFSSIRRGAEELNGTCDAFFLLPVDIPFVQVSTIQRLLDEFSKGSSILVCYPMYESRRGHPPLIDSSLIPQVLAHDGEGGLRGLLSKYDSQSISVPVEDPFVRMDVDTQEDVLRLKKELLRQ